MMQVEVMPRSEELAFINGYFTEAKCAKCTHHLQRDTIKQESS